jgi:hypothetical protein
MSIVMPPFLFFLKPVRIDVGQRLDERRLTVVDMSSRTDNDSLHFMILSRTVVLEGGGFVADSGDSCKSVF